ncbi:hypothetical protein HOB10_04620 [Candidatus Parcubacteria bacterium]|jgi:hypothetical protein|nr:hypothetical protein [Candidatus Parcubacteria bacterium]
MIFRSSKHSVDSDTGLEFDETTEVWVADFGSHNVETEIREQVLKLKPKKEKGISWILTSIILLLFIVATEFSLRQFAISLYWSEFTIFWVTWLWRLLLIVVWMYLSRFVWYVKIDKMFAVAIVSFTLAVIILAILKIFYVQAAWTWLNLLVEPIWMVLIVTLLGVLFLKFNKYK